MVGDRTERNNTLIKSLLIFTAALEAATGLALALAPSAVASVLLGSALDAPAASSVARVAGAALLALALACWLARNHGRALVAALLLYNSATVAVLAHAGLGLGLSGLGLWPAVGLHTVLAVWCVVGLRRVNATKV